jgi:LPXTG-motif cell wall-anchored protein
MQDPRPLRNTTPSSRTVLDRRHEGSSTGRRTLSVVLALLIGALALVSPGVLPSPPAAAQVLGPGQATIPGFSGYVTSSNTELGVGQLANGKYGVCTDTGSQFPWPGPGATHTTVSAPRTAYVLSHFMGKAVNDARTAAALWWVTGLDFGQNSQPGAMQARINEMKAESPAIFADVKARHDQMVDMANKYAAPAGGYQANVNLTSVASNRVEASGVGVKSGNDWVPDTPMTLTLEGAKWNANGQASIDVTSDTSPLKLVATQTSPGPVKITATASELADRTYEVWWAGGSSQHVLARGDFVTEKANDTLADDTGRARARKVDAVTGNPLAGAVFRVWGETDMNEEFNASTDGVRVERTTGAQGYTPFHQWFTGPQQQVCFREIEAPPGYQIDRTVKCIPARPLNAAPDAATIVITNVPGTPSQALVPLTVTKSAEGGDPAGMTGVTVGVRLDPAGPDFLTHTFTATDIVGGIAQWTTGAELDSDLDYFVAILSEPAGWVPVQAVVPAVLNGPGTAFTATLEDRRIWQPALVTQISHQLAAPGTTITDSVTVTSTGGHTLTGHWALLGPVAAIKGQDGGYTCEGVDWTNAAVVNAGDFTITGDGVYTVGETTVNTPGCHTYIESIDQSPSSEAFPTTPPGLTTETVLINASPTLVTKVSNQQVVVGEKIHDVVTVSGTADLAMEGHWRLLGPVAPGSQGTPRTVQACEGLNWDGAPVAAQGSFDIDHGDGEYSMGEHQVVAGGCYVYTQAIPATPTSQGVEETDPGILAETAIVTGAPGLVTQVSKQMGRVGDTITDSVVVSNTGGATITGHWRLLGPVAPVLDEQLGPICTGVDWTNAPVAGQGEFTVTGDGTYTVGETTVTEPGCFSYVEGLGETPTTPAHPETPPGIPSETTVITTGPTVVTHISDQRVEMGETITDTVTVAGTHGAAITGQWVLLGPVEPKTVNGKLTCRDLNWKNAPVAAQGEFDIAGDGTYEGVGEYKVQEAACFGYHEILPRTPTTEEVATVPGVFVETTLVKKAGEDGSSDASGNDDDELPDTGAPANLGLLGGLTGIALIGGVALLYAARRRSGKHHPNARMLSRASVEGTVPE